MRKSEKSRIMVKPASAYAHTTGNEVEYPANWSEDTNLKE